MRRAPHAAGGKTQPRPQRRRKWVPLFTSLALTHLPEAPGMIHRNAGRTGRALGATSRRFAKKALRETQSQALRPSRPLFFLPQLKFSAKHGSVCASALFQRVLERLRSSIEHVCKFSGKNARDPPPGGPLRTLAQAARRRRSSAA